MKRHLAALALIATAALGLTACAGGPPAPNADTGSQSSSAPSTETSKPSTENQEPSKPSGGQSASQACLDFAALFDEVGEKLTFTEDMISNPQQVVQVYDEIVKGLEDAASKVTNPEVKSAISALAHDFGVLRDAMQKVLNGDPSGAETIMSNLNGMQDSYLALIKTCS